MWCRGMMVGLALVAASCVHELDGDGAIVGVVEDPGVEEQAIVPSPFFSGDPATGAVFALDISFWEGTVAEQEMDCFWDSGVRHIVAGTQLEEVTRQQLDMAVRRGMTVDAYVYLYWSEDIGAQVDEAFAFTEGFPIGRLWLDVEEDPAGRSAGQLAELVRQAVDRCRDVGEERGVECGIYTGPAFWRSFMANTTSFSDVALWYAWYNGTARVEKRMLSSWDAERFGGWSAPAAKQWAEEAICGYGADKNTMLVTTAPSVMVDRTIPPDDGAPPPAPTRLMPSPGTGTALDEVKLGTAPIPRATRYELALEHWDGARWHPYFTWAGPNAFRKVSPVYDDATYRFRARAKNARGFGPWSSWSVFDFGVPTTTPPPSDDAPPPVPPPSPLPGVEGAPAGLTPDAATVTTPSVTLACAAVEGAARYQFSLETIDAAGARRPYTTYDRSAPSTTFWPQVGGVTYAWKVRARPSTGDWGPWSAEASFIRP